MKISSGIQDLPSQDLFHGPEGVGKSSLASTYPDAVFIDCEGSTGKLKVNRFEVENFTDYQEACNIICSEKGIKIKTVVIDTTDWLERMVIQQIVKEDQATSITDGRYGFGMGDKRIEEFFHTRILPSFKSFINLGKNVVLVSHSHIKSVDDPVIGRFDTYAMKMGKAGAILREWAHNVFFINYDQRIVKQPGLTKDKAVGNKKVIIHTQACPQYAAKRRDELPDKITFEKDTNPYPQIIGVKPDPAPQQVINQS
jgi:hypothetical protein